MINIPNKNKYRFSYIIGFRKSTEERLENINCVLDWLKQHNNQDDFEIIIVEQDKEKKCEFEGCKNIFIYNDGNYNRSWAFNVGAKNSNSEILIFADSDLLMKWKDFEDAVNLVETEYEAVDPKNNFVLNLNYSKFNPETQLKQGEFRERYGCVFSGGIVIFRKQSFYSLYGWPEEFEGWGGEDDAMSNKIKKFLHKYKQLNLPVFHLFHKSIGPKNNLNYNKNVENLKRIQRMSKEQIVEYYKDINFGNYKKYSKEIE